MNKPALALWLCFSIPINAFAQTEQDPSRTRETPTEWMSLFNGRDLEGWTPRIRGYENGVNFADTFRVEDGVLRVCYDGYEGRFADRFGHLFWHERLSHYLLRVEYRFTGEQLPDGPDWAFRNSGLMLHCADPASMVLDQEFPVSIEVQLLGGDGVRPRSTANLCTPGTHVEMNGELVTRHCTDSSSETYHGDQWVTVQIEVRGDEVIRHSIDGKVVLEYNKPQLDPGDAYGARLVVEGHVRLTDGFLALQSESHPVEFRKVEILKLEPGSSDR